MAPTAAAPSLSSSPSPHSSDSSLRRPYSTPKFAMALGMGMGASAATTSLSTTTASSRSVDHSFASSSPPSTFSHAANDNDLTSVSLAALDGLSKTLSPPSALSGLGGLKRSGSSARLGGLQRSSSSSNLSPLSDVPIASLNCLPTPRSTPAPVTSRQYSQFDRPPPSLDSDSNLESDNDDSLDSDYAAVDFAMPQQYQTFYSMDKQVDNDNDMDLDVSETTSRPRSPVYLNAEDDSAVRNMPQRHVDYLSHDWREEDIWESWKYVVARRGEVKNSARLENASWRTWMKSKNKLKTISPESLNWLKESDVTWLYGPLQTGCSHDDRCTSSNDPPSSSSTTKPILKKRTKSEAMLQRSLSTSSLVQQATAAIQSQTHLNRRPALQTAASAHVFMDHRRLSADNTPQHPMSLLSSGMASPSVERRHIHFNEAVRQCISIDPYDGEPALAEFSDDEEGIYMGIVKRNGTLRKRGPRMNKNRRVIAPLPDTVLKREEDQVDLESAMKHSFQSPVVSPSSSQETVRASTTLRHAKKSGSLFAGDSDSDEEEGLTFGSSSRTNDDDDAVEIEQEEDVSSAMKSELLRHRGRTMARPKGKSFSLDSESDEDEASDEEVVAMAPAPKKRTTNLADMLGGSSSDSSDAEYDDDDDETFSRSLGGVSMSGLSSKGSSGLDGSSLGGKGGGLLRSSSTSGLANMKSSGGLQRSSSGLLRTSSGMLSGKGSFFSSASSATRHGF